GGPFLVREGSLGKMGFRFHQVRNLHPGSDALRLSSWLNRSLSLSSHLRVKYGFRPGGDKASIRAAGISNRLYIRDQPGAKRCSHPVACMRRRLPSPLCSQQPSSAVISPMCVSWVADGGSASSVRPDSQSTHTSSSKSSPSERA